MERTATCKYPIETCLFNAVQLQPRIALSHSLSAMWAWFNAEVVSCPRFLRDYHRSIVVVGIDIDYTEPFWFFDTHELAVCCSAVRLRRQESMVECFFDFTGAERRFARVRLLWRVVAISDDPSLSAVPSQIDGELLSKFKPHEIEPSKPSRDVPGLVQQIEAEGALLTEGHHTFTICRHLCEVADQWAFIELPGLVGAGRESLVMAKGASFPDLRRSMKQRLLSFNAELSRPFYFFDEGDVRSRAYLLGERLVFVHRVTNRNSLDAQAAVVVEQF